MYQKVKTFIRTHVIRSILIGLVIVFAGNWAYGKMTSTAGVTKYTIGHVERGTISSSISGSGQVSVSQNLGVKPKATGDVTSVLVKKGQSVTAGTPLLQIDARDAAKTVREAQLSLQSAVLSLEKLQKPAETLSLLQAQNSYAQARRDLTTLKAPPDALALLQAANAVTQAEQSKVTADSDLSKAYDDAYTSASNVFADSPDVMSSLNSMFFDKTIDGYSENFWWYANQLTNDNDGVKKYQTAFNTSYDAAKKDLPIAQDLFKSINRNSPQADIENVVQKAKSMVSEVSDSVKNAKSYVTYVEANMKDNDRIVPAIITTNKNSLDTYASSIDGDLSSISTQSSSLSSKKSAVESAQRSLLEKKQSLEDLKNGADKDALKKSEETVAERKAALEKLTQGADALDIKSAQLTVQERRNSLSDAQEKLSDFSVKAPFDGVVADIPVQKGDSVSNGTAVVTLITTQMVAEIPLNEVDVAQIAVGQKATLSFDAVQDLSISGEVVELDNIGTVSQGVVSYKAKIAFDSQDARIKPSMSVVATVITATKTDVLLVPNSAIKSQGSNYYVEVPATDTGTQSSPVELAAAPTRKSIEIGIQNDESTEIISGLNENDAVVTSTIAATTTTAAPASGGLKIPGLGGNGGGGGGAARALGR